MTNQQNECAPNRPRLPTDTIWVTTWQNQQNDCAPSEDRSAWASAQSDQSLRCPHEETLGP